MSRSDEKRKSSLTALDDTEIPDNTYVNYVQNADKDALTEEVIEENAEDCIRHEKFYNCSPEEELQYSSKHKNIVTELREGQREMNEKFADQRTHSDSQCEHDGRSTCIRCQEKAAGVIAFIVCLMFIVAQYAVMDYYFISAAPNDSYWYGWAAIDVFVILVLIWLTNLSMKYETNDSKIHGTNDKKIKYAWIKWFIYSTLLMLKTAVYLQLFQRNVLANTESKFFTDHQFRFILTLSVVVFLYMFASSHNTCGKSQRQLYIGYLAIYVALDLLDANYFLDLSRQAIIHDWYQNFPTWLSALEFHLAILLLTALVWVAPILLLIRVGSGLFPYTISTMNLVVDLIYAALVNLPFLVFRLYLYYLLVIENGAHYEIDIMVIKNIFMMCVAIRNVWAIRQKRTEGKVSLRPYNKDDDDVEIHHRNEQSKRLKFTQPKHEFHVTESELLAPESRHTDHVTESI